MQQYDYFMLTKRCHSQYLSIIRLHKWLILLSYDYNQN